MEGYSCPYWINQMQMRAHFADHKKGAMPTVIHHEVGDEGVSLFNLEQVNGIKWDMPIEPANPLKESERILAGFKDMPRILEGYSRCGYYYDLDGIAILSRYRFIDTQDFYTVLFHECVHATGHDKRLTRPTILKPRTNKKDPAYLKEELTAEIGAAFISQEAGFSSTNLMHQDYINMMIDFLTKHPMAFWRSCVDAQAAADYILARKIDEINTNAENAEKDTLPHHHTEAGDRAAI